MYDNIIHDIIILYLIMHIELESNTKLNIIMRQGFSNTVDRTLLVTCLKLVVTHEFVFP